MHETNGGGWIEVICGPMFSGKTEELLRRIRRVEIARQKIQLFKPKIDVRYSAQDVVSHSERRSPANQVEYSGDILKLTEATTNVVAVDEAQFFDADIAQAIEALAHQGKRVIVAGLDADYLARPFGPMPVIIATADYVTKLLAICVRCGNPANRTQKIAGGSRQIEVGGHDQYEARCRKCFVPYRS